MNLGVGLFSEEGFFFLNFKVYKLTKVTHSDTQYPCKFSSGTFFKGGGSVSSSGKYQLEVKHASKLALIY